MPVTITVADHKSESYHNRNAKIASNDALLEGTSLSDSKNCKWIIQSSVSEDEFSKSHIVESNNGFVHAAFTAYSWHHHLVIRPEDVWFAILSQLNVYINANAEALRDHFVSHQGHKELRVKEVGNIHTVDFGMLARRMTALIQENVKDPDLRDWIMPAFSTTTVTDRTTAAVLMMGSMKAYFKYKCRLKCGIPTVTLLGERADYEDILKRLEKLPELGPEASTFADLLRPVLRNFIATFDPEQSAVSHDFWSKIAHRLGGGSGPSYLGGWLTAFCFWNDKGECMYDQKGPRNPWETDSDRLELDGVSYHEVDISDIPNGFASVPVLVDDNGKEYKTKMIAGSLGIKVTSKDSSQAGTEEKLDSLQSLSGWMMYEIKE
ncbi:hypothetical protein AA0112_g10715 [Alternaria arborescens]|uniref:hypothetical protein n=1 Tax=Alternaria arborescens TaxID=156630 RepID=UPI001075561F|nr:hypothetical protein AA0111_g10645 [Alternaria arborescens]RYN20296.1 hypothetical protein AA0112_g10715 [Alternaria arborescens]RYO18650.1 hypothetical protein AA0111_g10645 [Alternaria arborescens]